MQPGDGGRGHNLVTRRVLAGQGDIAVGLLRLLAAWTALTKQQEPGWCSVKSVPVTPSVCDVPAKPDIAPDPSPHAFTPLLPQTLDGFEEQGARLREPGLPWALEPVNAGSNPVQILLVSLAL